MGRAASGTRGSGTDGFALIEVTLALVLIALLAALALPGLVRSTGAGALRVTEMQVSALLRDARTAAITTGAATAAVVDRRGRTVRAAAIGAAVALPSGTAARLEPAAIRFFADGRSSGGTLTLATATTRATIAVSPDTGAVDVRAR